MPGVGPEIVIIGAGVIGLSCAVALARRGARVTLVEAQPTRSAHARWFGENSASAIAAGMLGAYSESLNEPAGAHPHAQALRAAGLRAWRGFAQSLEADREVGGPFGGCLIVAGRPDRAAALQDLARRAADDGARAELLDAGAVKALEPRLAKGLLAGLLLRDEGQASPRLALTAIADAAAEAGVRLVRGRAIALGRAAGRKQVRLEGGALLACDGVVIATGAGGALGLAEAAPSLLRLSTAAGCVVSVKGLPLSRTVRADEVYIAAGADGVQRIGGGMAPGPFDAAQQTALQDQLLAAAGALLPGEPIAARVLGAQAGQRPMSPDHAPLIGRDGPDGALVAIGHGRNGWLLAPLTAQIISAYVFEEALAPLWAAVAPQRFG